MSISEQAEMKSQGVLPNLLWFVGLLTLFSAGAYYFVIEHGLRRYYLGFLMWTPALAALLTCKVRGISITSLGWRWGESRWLWTAYSLPIIYGLIAYGIIWASGLGGLIDSRFIKEVAYFLGLAGWSETATVVFGVVMLGSVGMLWHTATSLGEEIGWRGFLTAQLSRRYAFPVVAFISGLVWALWHAPIIFFTKYNAGPVALELQFFNFTILCIGLSFMMTYLRLKADSVWPCVILHAAHNIYILTIFQPMTIQYKHTWRYANEFGFVLPIVVLVIGIGFWYMASKEGLGKPNSDEKTA